MSKSLFVFLLWAAASLLLIALGIADFFAKKPAVFFSNVERPQVSDLKRYNVAVGWLTIGFGAVFLLFGLPLLLPGGEAWILLSIPGVMLSVIAAMVVYTQCIEKKFKVNSRPSTAARYPCPCYGNLTFDAPLKGEYDICPVCFWEDTPYSEDEPDEVWGGNHVSLNEARCNYRAIGACREDVLPYVRAPLPEEMPKA